MTSQAWHRCRWSLACCCLIGLGPLPARTAPTDAVTTLIAQAGNADDDRARLEALQRLRDTPGIAAGLKQDAENMFAAVERWLDGRKLAYFGTEIQRTLDYDFKLAPTSPLYPLTHLYRGRMLVWITLESGGLMNNVNRRKELLGKAVTEFQAAAAAFPRNRIAGMYLGTPIPAAKQYPAVKGAPEWAALQRENLEHLADIIVWWIEHRMQPNGEYGGGWGDDCEMWRWWVPVLVAFDDPQVSRTQARFSEALMSQAHMRDGYTRNITDVEHTAEDSADVITPMMHLDPDNPAWKRRALRLAELMETLWTGRNDRGQLQFKSTYFAVDRVDARPDRACDTVYHPRAVQPALLLWQRTGDAKLGKLFTAWLDTWVDAARAERGKPAGILPSAIHWPDGRVGGTSPDWWDPRNHPSEPTLYEWPSAMRMMDNSLLLAWHMSKDEKYLQPLRSMAAIRLKWLQQPAEGAAPGSEAWCAERLGFLAETLAKYQRLTGSKEFDALLSREKSSAIGLDPTQDRAAVVTALRKSAEALRVNFEGYTSEVRYTDRVLRFPSLFGRNMLFPEPLDKIRTPNTQLLYSLATGDPGDAGYMPLAAVRWLTPARDIAAMVTAVGTDRFTAQLFHFGTQPRPMAAELYLLAAGKYTGELRDMKGAVIGRSFPVTVIGARTRIAFELPARKACVLRVSGQARS
jgi:hypothetical protein